MLRLTVKGGRQKSVVHHALRQALDRNLGMRGHGNQLESRHCFWRAEQGPDVTAAVGGAHLC